MKWSRIKHFKFLVQIQYNWSNLESLSDFSRTMPVMKLLDIIRDHLRYKLRIRKIHILYIVWAIVVPNPIRDIIPTLPYSKDIEVFCKELIASACHTHPGYDSDNSVVLKVLVRCFQGSNHMINVHPFIRNLNVCRSLLDL